MRASGHRKPDGPITLTTTPPLANGRRVPAARERRWAAAWQRVDCLEPQVATPCRALLAHVESARAPLNQLRAADRRVRRQRADDASAEHVLLFITADVLDLFGVLLGQVSDLVPGLPGWSNNADPMNADGTASLLDRYLRVLGSAASDPRLPDDLAEAIRRSAAALDDWYADMESLLDAVDEQVIAPVRTRFPADDHAGTP